MREDRPDPDELLSRVLRSEAKEMRGRLKVFLGASAGVGKTFAMLEAAHRLKKGGVDVVVGYVESHGRAETDALLQGLEVLPPRALEYRGTTLREFDLDAALKRQPQLLLVDELAHTNAPGSLHAKRWQDVEALRAAGISVLTTLNIQHIESQNDLVAQITQVTVRETLPDSVLEEADEVELVDLPPEELLQRFREGKVYVPEMAERARQGFFRLGNLIALRQLALRYTAGRVDRQMQEWRRDQAVQKAWPVAERLLVCVGPSPQSAKVVRAAKRMAAQLQAELIAVYVETPATASLPAPDRERVIETLRLAEQLGAETATITGSDVAGAVLRYARERNASKIVIGKPTRRAWRDYFRGSPVDRMARQSGEIDLYVIKGEDAPSVEESRERPPARPLQIAPYAWSAGIVVLSSLLAWALFGRLDPVNLVMVYFPGVVFVATRFGRGPSILASVLSVLAFDFFFVPPFLTFAVSDQEYVVTFAVMLLVGVVVSTLAAQTRQQAESATERERRTASLYSMSRELAGTRGREELSECVRRHVEGVFQGRATLFFPDEDGKVRRVGRGPEVPPEEQGVAQWTYDHKQASGLGTRTLPGSKARAVPLMAGNQVVGVLSFEPSSPQDFLEPQPVELLETFGTQAALAFERDRLAREAGETLVAVEAEKLRSTLLASISHDLRTPLAAIRGAADTLLTSPSAEAGARIDLLRGIREEADYVTRMVSNLLDLTRLESGAVPLRKESYSVVEVVSAVTELLEATLKDRPLAIQIPADLPLVPMDAALIQQVIFNLLENAARHTPEGTPIELSARAGDRQLTIEVADRGPGLRAGEERKVFDKFFRTTPEGKRSGMGLGLSLSDEIVRLHGGRIWAENRPGGGAVFRFTLPLGEAAA